MHRLSHLAALALFTAALACSSCHDSTSPPGPSITGTWALQTVNRAPLPFTTQIDDTTKTELLAETFDMKGTSPSEGSYSLMLTERLTSGSRVETLTPPPLHRTFTWNDTTVTLYVSTDIHGGRLTGSWSGNTLTITNSTGVPWVYTRK